MESTFFIPQSSSIKTIVHSFWHMEGETVYKTETILPKGIVEIIFNFSDHCSIQAELGGRQYQLPKSFIGGFNTQPIQMQLPHHQIFFGIRFQPTAIRYVFGVPAGEFADHAVDLTLIDASLNSLWHQLIEESTFAGRVSIVAAWLTRKMYDIPVKDKLLDLFLNDLNQCVPSVSALSKNIGYSPRHLARKLKELTGMNTEEVLRYKKYLQAVNLIHYTNLSLTEVAYSCQFADQSHFINTFKSLAGMTPGEYKNFKSPLQGHIYENVR